MNLKIFIQKFEEKTLMNNQSCNEFIFKNGNIYLVNYGVKLFLATTWEDFIVIKFRDDVKSGIKKLLKELSNKKILFVTREIEYLKDPTNIEHKTNILNMLNYFIKGGWYKTFETKYKIDFFDLVYLYVHTFNCEEEFNTCTEIINRENSYYYPFLGNRVIGLEWNYLEKYDKIETNYITKYQYLFRNYRIYRINNFDI
jgi:hypothetical protein